MSSISSLHPFWSGDNTNMSHAGSRDGIQDRDSNSFLFDSLPTHVYYSELSAWIDLHLSMNDILYPGTTYCRWKYDNYCIKRITWSSYSIIISFLSSTFLKTFFIYYGMTLSLCLVSIAPSYGSVSCSPTSSSDAFVEGSTLKESAINNTFGKTQNVINKLLQY